MLKDGVVVLGAGALMGGNASTGLPRRGASAQLAGLVAARPIMHPTLAIRLGFFFLRKASDTGCLAFICINHYSLKIGRFFLLCRSLTSLSLFAV